MSVIYQALSAGALVGIGIGLPIGYVWRPFVERWRGEQQFAEYMERVVNAEGAEERRNAIRRQLHDSGRRTMRLDGGTPAKVHRMRRRTGWKAMRHHAANRKES